jgi:SAM-dependent methyltransferase
VLHSLVSPAVPAPLAAIAGRLRCPVCLQPLAPAGASLVCAHRHTYDVARQGYVTLQAPARSHAMGDDAGMIAARAAVYEAGHFEPLTAVLAAEARAVEEHDSQGPGSPAVLDVGAGTGHHLAVVLDGLPRAQGVAVDASRDASRRAARAHSRIAAVRADIWQQIPLGDATVDLALSVFAPRNVSELVRVLRPGGALMIVTPAPDHLHELADLHAIRIDPCKPERLDRQTGPALPPGQIRRISWTMRLAPHEAEAVLRMGPAAKHLRPDLDRRLGSLPQPLLVTGAVEVRMFRYQAQDQ